MSWGISICGCVFPDRKKTQYVNNQNGMQAKGLPDMIGMEAPLELPIFIHYRPSMRVAVFNTLVHIGAIFCLFLADIPATVMGLFGACVLIHYGVYIKRFLSPENICFKLDKHDQWQLLRDNDEAGRPEITARSASPSAVRGSSLQRHNGPDLFLCADPRQPGQTDLETITRQTALAALSQAELI